MKTFLLPPLVMRARLLCAHATFIRPSGPYTEFDALMRADSARQDATAVQRLMALSRAHIIPKDTF
jgi:hypothetical protein